LIESALECARLREAINDAIGCLHRDLASPTDWAGRKALGIMNRLTDALDERAGR
jgi:hypothetical protein